MDALILRRRNAKAMESQRCEVTYDSSVMMTFHGSDDEMPGKPLPHNRHMRSKINTGLLFNRKQRQLGKMRC
jgi:hypothetical protein